MTDRISGQSAALPFRVSKIGEPEFLLITTRKSGRWSIPKGGVKSGMLPHRSAAREAYEEAGIIGIINGVPLGMYRVRKTVRVFEVRVFGLTVTSELQVWPEMRERQRRWFNVVSALEQVADTDLRPIIDSFAQQLRASAVFHDLP